MYICDDMLRNSEWNKSPEKNKKKNRQTACIEKSNKEILVFSNLSEGKLNVVFVKVIFVVSMYIKKGSPVPGTSQEYLLSCFLY